MNLESGGRQGQTRGRALAPGTGEGSSGSWYFRVASSGEPLEQVETAEPPDGTDHFLSKRLPILDAGGLPDMVGNIAIDMTERQRAAAGPGHRTAALPGSPLEQLPV